ncbi:hypothetical protein EMCRGX_G000981 [Ephydatia muelleri]
MNRCKFCVAPVLDSKKRRLLSSQESERNAAALVDLACEAGVARNEATKEYTTGYLCTKCFNSIGNFSALKEKVGRLKGEFVSKLHESLRSCDSAMTSESKGTKRKASTQQSGKAVKAVRNHLLARIHRTIRQEMKNILTSRDCTVTLNESNPGIFTSDAWENQFTALQHVAPVLTGILNASIPRNSSRRQCTMASCIGILVKSHGRSTLAHLFTSLILYSGHAAKQVYARLQKLGLCLSINSTLKLIDILGDDHDHLVKDWVTTLTTQTASSNVRSILECGLGIESSFTQGFITGLPTVHLSNDSSDSACSEFDVQSLPDPVYASTPRPSIASLSLNEDSFVSPLSPDISALTSTSYEDFTPQPKEHDTSPCPSMQGSAEIGNEETEEWSGFRLVGDNIDKNVKPRDMRINSQTSSLHYFHAYAVKDRISFKHLSADATMIFPQDIDFNVFYPSVEDNFQLVSNFETLVTRMFVQHIPGLQSLSAMANHHIEHQYSKNMALTEIRSVLLKNENVLNDMVDILDELHKYVPRTTTMQTIHVCTGGGGTTAVDIHVNTFSHIPLEGDQLTVARIRGSQRVEFNAENGDERLEGFFPVIEDWHTKMCFMEVIWKRLYNSCSGMDAGTLFQLREVINRRNVISDVTKDLTACEEFMELVTTAHVLTAAMHVAGASNLTDLSSKILSKENPTAAATSLVQTLCRQMVTIEFIMDKSTCGSGDRVVEYAMETLSLGLLLLEFKDSIREGDGYRVLRCWKYFLLIFRATQHKNYCIEALNLLMQYYYILPQRYAEQMLLLKGTVTHLGANKTPQAIVRAGKALGVLKNIITVFDKLTGGWATSNHTTRSEAEDLMKVVTELSQNRVFSPQSGRKHRTFPSIECNKLIASINKKKLHLWMTKKVSQILKLCTLSR